MMVFLCGMYAYAYAVHITLSSCIEYIKPKQYAERASGISHLYRFSCNILCTLPAAATSIQRAFTSFVRRSMYVYMKSKSFILTCMHV